MATEGVSINPSTWSTPVTGVNRKMIACVRPINWAIERLRRRRIWRARERGSASNLDVPLILVRTTANRQVVVGMCAAARAQGVGAGMSLAQARALCPGMVYAEEDAARDAKALEALGRWMMRFTPVVQVSEGGIFLDVTGTERLYGSLEELMGRIERALAGVRVPARLAVAPTVGGAWAMTYAEGAAVAGRAPQAEPLKNSAAEIPIVTGDIGEAIASLPPVVLRLEEETLATLHHLGLRTVGEVVALPRALLPARFGPMLLKRIDQALGRVGEPLVPLRYQAPIEAGVDFDGVVDSLDVLWLTFKDLIAEVAGHLVRRGLGARRLAVTFVRPYAPMVERTIELSRPSRNPAILFNLIRCTMETIGDAAPQRGGGKRPARFRLHTQAGARRERRTLDQSDFVSRGFTGLRLAVPVFERLSEEQIFLLEQEEQLGQADLDRLIERLRIRMGQDGLVAVEAVESHVPERAYREGSGKGSGFRVQGSGKKRGTGALISPAEPYALNPEPSSRPLHLLSMPCEVRVMVRPSHDRDGAPVAFTLEGQTRSIVHAVGPERIGGAWWTGHDKTRDYFDVEDEAGRRWWLFRVVQSSRWYLHGSFE